VQDNTNLELSAFCDSPTRKKFLEDCFGISSNQLKKNNLSKAWLEIPVKKMQVLTIPLNIANHLRINPIYAGSPVRIIKENKHFTAIHKPPFIHTHPLSYCESDNILSALRALGEEDVLNVNQHNYDRGLLFRLDFETSGLLIATKDENIYKEIRKNFHSVFKEKIYIAIVHGEVIAENIFTHRLKPYGEKSHKMVESHHVTDSIVQLSFVKLAYNKQENISLVAIKLRDGVRHQIRAQFSIANHPLLGDELYGGKKSKRLYLHCYYYAMEINDETFNAIDSNLELFDNFFDLNSCFEMISNKFGIG
jgi:23S rRNA pseudouridine1911/1915/1917 synthase